MKFPRNFRPKFPELVISNIQRHVISNALGRRRKATPCSRMIEVAERYSADFSQPFGNVKHGPAVVVVRDNGVRYGMQETPPYRALAHPVIPRVFGKNSRIGKLLEKSELNFICVAGAQPFGISLAALAKRWVIILCLRNPRIEPSGQKRFRINRITKEQKQFVLDFT